MPRPKGSKNKPKDQTDMAPTKTAERTETIADQAESKGELAHFEPARLPHHPAIEQRFGIDKGMWKVLTDAIFPAAKTPDSIVLALSYCKSRGLDIMKRPVHIVPMYDSQRGGYVETVWPGISELRTTASRTKGYAGCDTAEFGKTIQKKFTGRVKRNGQWVDETVEVEFPEYCRITVYRMVEGQRCTFVGPKVSWLETYATQGPSDLPNKMWQERPEGQLEKCAEAAALRRAFPEEIGNELTAEEMVGRQVHDLHVEVPALVGQNAAARDTAPPRSAPQAQQENVEEARDGKPAPRQPKAEPPRDAAPPRQAATRAAAEAAPLASETQPHKISGNGHDAESWTAKYLDLLKTSPDTATAFKWIDANSEPLARVNKLRPSTYNKIKNETERLLEKLRDEAAKKEAKTKPAPQTSPVDNMDEPPEQEPELDMEDGASEPGMDEPPRGNREPPSDNPEDILKWIDATLKAASAEDFESVWENECQQYTLDMIPPDKKEALRIYDFHKGKKR